jgi:flavin reductase (DIM6/NTAB) family NADH-FMN oxidoreductase RutF
MMTARFARPTAFGPDSPLYRPPAHFLRGCLSRFATGVAVVSFAEPGGSPAGVRKYRGVTVNSFTSVSIDPPLILVALQRTVPSHDLLRGRCFTVNVLGAEQRDFAVRFAGGKQGQHSAGGKQGEHSAGGKQGQHSAGGKQGQHSAGRPLPSLRPAWTEGEHAPRLAGSLCYFECTPWAEYDGGDHTLFLGEVQHFDYRDGDALGFVNGQFTLIPQSVPGHEALL